MLHAAMDCIVVFVAVGLLLLAFLGVNLHRYCLIWVTREVVACPTLAGLAVLAIWSHGR